MVAKIPAFAIVVAVTACLSQAATANNQHDESMRTAPKQIPQLSQSHKERFLSKISKGKKSECWPWLGNPIKDGYGHFRIGNLGKFYAHRIAFFLHNGSISNLLVLHKCDNPICCNPHHLFQGTDADNNQDRHKKGRSVFNFGEDHHNSKLTDREVIEIRRLALSGEMYQYDIAKKFNTTQAHVSCIKLSKTRIRSV